MRHAHLQALLAESVGPVEAEELAAVLGPLTGLVDSAPVASPEHRALFEAGGAASPDKAVADDGFGPRPRRSSTLAGVVVLALSGVGATGLSAAANTLPGPLQHQVSRFSAHYLPFQFPDPQARTARGVRPPPDVLLAPAPGRKLRLDVDRDATAEAVWRALRLVRSEAAGHWADSDRARVQGADRRAEASAYALPSGTQASNTAPEKTAGPDDARSSSGSDQAPVDDAQASASKRDDRKPDEDGHPEKKGGTGGGGQRSSPREGPRHLWAVASSVGKNKPVDRDEDSAKTSGGIDEAGDGRGRGAPNDPLHEDDTQGADPVPVEDARGQEEAPAPDPGDVPSG